MIILVFIVLIIIALSYRACIRQEIEDIFQRISNVEKNNCTLTAFYAIDISTARTFKEILMIEEKYVSDYYNNLKRLAEFLKKSERPMHKFFMTDKEKEKYAEVFEDLRKTEEELEHLKKQKEMLSSEGFIFKDLKDLIPEVKYEDAIEMLKAFLNSNEHVLTKEERQKYTEILKAKEKIA